MNPDEAFAVHAMAAEGGQDGDGHADHAELVAAGASEAGLERPRKARMKRTAAIR